MLFCIKVVIEGVVGSYLGDIAIDDVSMTPGCVLMNGPGNTRHIVIHACIYANKGVENDTIFTLSEIEPVL